MFDTPRKELNAFEDYLAEKLHSSVAFIEAIAEDLVSAGGKRLRPSLAFLAGRILGAAPKATMQVALAVELLHSASLLHDDLIDDADTRRGHEAAFRRYGNVVSVMSGDFMLAKVLAILAEAKSPDFTMLMSQTAADICEAEVLQFQMASLETYSFENYQRIITGKTAVLLAAALEGVAILSGASQEQCEALRHFGLCYGRAFQMQDDYLDLLGNAQQLGKPIGGDLREGKATFAVLKLILDEEIAEARAILRRHAARDGDVEKIQELVLAYKIDKLAQDKIMKETKQAIVALKPFPKSEAKDVLVGLAKREMDRGS